MQSLQPIWYCTCRSSMPQNIQFLSHSSPSIARRISQARRKQIVLPGSTRLFSTTPSCSLEQSLPSTPSRSQSKESGPTTPPRSSPWASLTQGQRPQGTTAPSSSPHINLISQDLHAKLDVLEIVKPRSRGSLWPASPGKSFDGSLTSRIGRDIDLHDAKSTHDALEAVHLRLSPMLGRTVAVDPESGRDLQSAIRSLQMLCSRNKLSRDVASQREHIRRGQRMKLLKSQRWRALFKQGFASEVARVKRMKRQGW